MQNERYFKCWYTEMIRLVFHITTMLSINSQPLVLFEPWCQTDVGRMVFYVFKTSTAIGLKSDLRRIYPQRDILSAHIAFNAGCYTEFQSQACLLLWFYLSFCYFKNWIEWDFFVISDKQIMFWIALICLPVHLFVIDIAKKGISGLHEILWRNLRW